MKEFVQHMESVKKEKDSSGGKWKDSEQIRALIKAAEPTENEARDLQYMTLKDYQELKGRRGWPPMQTHYLPDYALDYSDEKSE